MRGLFASFIVLAALHARTVSAAPDTLAPVNITAFDERGAALTIDDVTSRATSHLFRPLNTLPETNRSIARWYRFDVPKSDMPLILHLKQPVSDADLYFLRRNNIYGVVHIGMRVPFNQRSYGVAWPSARITPQMIKGSPLYLRTYGQTAKVEFQPEGQYASFRSSLSGGTLLFTGFIAAIGLLSLGLLLYLREPMFGFHALLMAVSILYILTANGLSWQYLWPSASVDIYAADALTYTAYILGIVLFGRSFLSLAAHLRVYDRLLWAAFGLNSAFTVLIQPLWPDSTSIGAITPLVNFAPFLVLLIAAIIRLRSGFRQARFFLIGFGGMFLTFTVVGALYRLMRWPYNASNLVISLAFDFGVAFDSLFFQFALADRLISANRERDDAQRKELSAQQQAIETQRTAIQTLERHNAAFTRFVPHAFLELLERSDIVEVQLGDHVEREMGILFSDIRSFTTLSEQMTPRESFDFVNAIFAQIGPVIRDHDGFIDKYIGDAVMAIFPRSPTDAIDAAITLQREVRRFNEDRARGLQAPVAVGVGGHWGKLILGTIGEHQRVETTVISDAVNVASRLQGITKACGARIIVSSGLVNALDDRNRYCLRPMGSFEVAGLSHPINVFEVCDADDPDAIISKMSTLESFEAALQAYEAGDFVRSQRLFESILKRNPGDGPAAHYRERSIQRQTVAKNLGEQLQRRPEI